MPEPQKFHIGLIDLFSVWLPGALLSWVLQWDLAPCLESSGYPLPAPGIESWAVFLFASYLTGHFVFVLGSMILDPFDKRVRKAVEDEWEEMKAQHPEWGLGAEPVDSGERRAKAWREWQEQRASKALREGFWRVLRPFLRWLGNRLFDAHDWEALDRIRTCKRTHLSRIAADPTMNCFQWSKARLALGHSEALASVQRFEADSKFFRSLCVVLAILAAWALLRCRWPFAAIALALLPGALWRFMELRGKSISQAYWFVLALEADPVAAERKAEA